MGRRAALGSLAMLLAVLAPATSAAADVTGDCQIQGTVQTNPPVQTVGGQGTYQFNDLTLVCEGVEGGDNPVVVQLDLSSSGTYESAVCGTGTARSTSNVVNGVTVLSGSSTIDWESLVGNLGYEIEFVAGQGTMTWLEADGSESPGGVVSLAPDPGAGAPPNPPPGGSDCVSSLEVTGTGIRVEASTESCTNTPATPITVKENGMKWIEGKNVFSCANAHGGMTACAALERKQPITGFWLQVSDEACATANPANGPQTSSPTATIRIPCLENGEYRTRGRGTGVGVENKVSDTSPSVHIVCTKG